MDAIFLIMVFIIFLLFIIVKGIFCLSLKRIFIIFATTLFIATLCILFFKPIVHKPFVFSTVEYLLKFNNDGSITTIEETTQNVLKEDYE